MKRTAFVAALLSVVAACSPTSSGGATTTTPTPTTIASNTTTTLDDGFPVTVEADNGPVTIEERPEAVVSLSAVATETLFEIGAGPQVVAVDDQSNYPADAPITDLSGFTPNLEAILAYDPDLVVIAFDPGDLVSGLEAVGVPVLYLNAAVDIPGVYHQIELLGSATGNVDAAEEVNQEVEDGLEEAVTAVDGAGDGVTYYHEVDATFYTVTSDTLFGQIYELFGMVNIADEADEAGSGYPQLSSEYVVLADPALIFLADTLYGESAATVSARPGWDAMTSVQNGAIVELDSHIASRWGPRVDEFAQAVADGLAEHS